MGELTSRWTQLRPHPVQHRLWNSPHRFNIVPAGRRSGKTELAKRKLVHRAMRGTAFDNARFFAAAPIRDQAKRIYWRDLKALIPPQFMAGKPSETELVIRLINDSEIHVFGMDAPERIEGSPWDGGVLDEYANMKEGAWGENVRPALADRQGWCDLVGVPEGRNHYYEMDQRAQAEVALRGNAAEFGSFTWKSSDILPASEIEAAKRDLPPKVFQQEYEGSFVDWSGYVMFELEKWLVDERPVAYPSRCEAVFAVIDTAIKSGQENDCTAVVYFALSRYGDYPLTILDYEALQIDGSLLEQWLPTVYQRLEELARLTGAVRGHVGAWIEDKGSGTILLQQAARRGWSAMAIDTHLTALGKDERAISVSGYHYQGKCKISAIAYEKLINVKGISRNHLVTQVLGFRIGDKEAYKRADDLVDCYTYGLSIALGDSEGN